jgi:hypothetical protein
MLFRKPPCIINCDQPTVFSDNEQLKKWLAFLNSLRDNPFKAKSSDKRSLPSPLDQAFLQEKINTASNDSDYLSRYQKTISDLTSPNVIEKSTNNNVGEVSLQDQVAPLTYLDQDQNPINQVISEPSIEGETNISPFTNPRNGPYFIPTGTPNVVSNGNPFIVGGPGVGGPGVGGPGVGGPGDGGPGDGGPGDGTNNPISSVPTPRSDYLILGLVFAFGLIRFKLLQRAYDFRF